MTHSPSAIRALLAEHGLEASRALGQNFMADANIVRKIVRLAGVGPGDRVVEVGAGLGSLTLALLEAGAEVTAIEVDQHLAPVLRSVVEPEGATVVEADAMQLDWAALLGPPDPARPWSLVATSPTTSPPRWCSTCWRRCRPSSGCSCSCSSRWASASPPGRARRRTASRR